MEMGNSLRGPWRWIDQPGDQTDTNIHFDWPNGTSTYFNNKPLLGQKLVQHR